MANLYKYSVQEAQNAAFGQAGSIFIDQATADADATPLSGVFVAIQFIEDTIFGTLTAETSELYPASNGTSTSVDANAGSNTSGQTFPQGVTIYGRWTTINLTSGKIIAYVG
jgi:hypothetical protein